MARPEIATELTFSMQSAAIRNFDGAQRLTSEVKLAIERGIVRLAVKDLGNTRVKRHG